MLDIGKLQCQLGRQWEGLERHLCYSSKQQRAPWHKQSTHVRKGSVTVAFCNT